ncbi:hypothetical protein [Streptomyces viridochromogenes]|uniref:hypothetical protein n=1 Tax=Streptomyces viridochromogenes TaxID=1938 RepID=UPI00131A47AE|nr:hypothetical protein [Streptomyces viridochromogenes]
MPPVPVCRPGRAGAGADDGVPAGAGTAPAPAAEPVVRLSEATGLTPTPASGDTRDDAPPGDAARPPLLGMR